MASRSASYSKLASEDGTGTSAAAAVAAEAASLPLLAPLAALEAWLADAAAACGLPAVVGPDDDRQGSHDGDDDALVYGELSLGALAWALCAHAPELRSHTGGGGALFVDLGCGTGKCLLLAALCPFVAEARGVEVLPARAAAAAALAARFSARPPAASSAPCRVRVRCASALDTGELPPEAAFVLLNWLTWPAEMAEALQPALDALRPGALVATVVVPLPSAAFRLLRARHVACSWGSADLLIHRRMEHGAAWQRRRRASGNDVDELLRDIDALDAAGVLRALQLERQAANSVADDDEEDAASQLRTRKRLLVSGCGDSVLPMQLAAQLRGVAVHGTDLDPICTAAQRKRAAAVTWRKAAAAPIFAATDVRDLPLDDATWEDKHSGCDLEDDGDAGDASDAAPRLFDALLDQCTLDALPCHRGGLALLHGALASLSASLAPGGVAVLLSQRPPEVAVPLLTAHPAMQWRLLSCAPVAASPAVTCYLLQRTDSAADGPKAADEALSAAWGSCTPATPPVRCSFAVCGKAAAGQRWFECASCVAEAVCVACAATCHAGHALAPAPPPRSGRLERGFCDCGFSGRCRACGARSLGDDHNEPLPI